MDKIRQFFRVILAIILAIVLLYVYLFWDAACRLEKRLSRPEKNLKHGVNILIKTTENRGK